MTTPEIWDALIRPAWRFEKGRPSSNDALDAVEAELGVRLPPGVRWLDQQRFVVGQRRLAYIRIGRDPYGEIRERVLVGPDVRSERVANQLGQPHWWSQFEGLDVVEPWLSKLVVVAIDDYFGAYMLDYHFDTEHPPVVYANWDEPFPRELELWGEFGYMQLVADSFEDFLALPEAEYESDVPEFEPVRPSRRDEWAEWWAPRVAARYEELGIRPRSPW